MSGKTKYVPKVRVKSTKFILYNIDEFFEKTNILKNILSNEKY